jgi:hypothetical protein
MQNQHKAAKTEEQVLIEREELVNERMRLENDTMKVKLALLRQKMEIPNPDDLQIQSQLEAELNNL